MSDISETLFWRDKAVAFEGQAKQQATTIKALEQKVNELESRTVDALSHGAISRMQEWLPTAGDRDLAAYCTAVEALENDMRSDPEFLSHRDFGTLDRSVTLSVFNRVATQAKHDWLFGRNQPETKEPEVYEGPTRRGEMSPEHKASYIRHHGMTAFLRLPV